MGLILFYFAFRPNTGKSSHLCLVVSVMLATALALSVLGYYQLNRGHHFARYRGSCRLPCHMRRQQVCPMKSRLRDGGQRQAQEGVVVMGNLGEWKGTLFFITISVTFYILCKIRIGLHLINSTSSWMQFRQKQRARTLDSWGHWSRSWHNHQVQLEIILLIKTCCAH